MGPLRFWPQIQAVGLSIRDIRISLSQPKPTNTNGWIYAQTHAEVFCREAERFWGNSLVNTKPDATYHLDLRLLTSASPKAANNLRRLAKNTLINALGQK